MNTADHPTFKSYDRASPILTDDLPSSTQTRRAGSANGSPLGPLPGQHLDDADLLAWKRQFANISLREQNALSSSAEDLTQLDSRIPYQFEVFGQNYDDMDDDEIHFDNGTGFDYDVGIQERLKKANEEFQHDATPAELKHRQRVSFDAVVRAVDIEQDPHEHETFNSQARSAVPTVNEEPTTPVVETAPSPPSATTPAAAATNSASATTNEPASHQYTVPLNDTQEREGPTLLQTIKAQQFHGITPTGERWSIPRAHPTPHERNLDEEKPSSPQPVSESPENSRSDSTKPQGQMVVSINGGFELQDADDYMAKRQATETMDSTKRTVENREQTSSPRVTLTPIPGKETKDNDKSPRSLASQRPTLPSIRPKSSVGPSSRTDEKKPTRPMSASVTKNPQITFLKPSAGVDFDELNRKAAEKKREQMREEQRKKEEEEKKRKEKEQQAKDVYNHWLEEKEKERKRLIEVKRMEQEEREAKAKTCSKELADQREQKYKEWIERKNREMVMLSEFKKLQADEDETISGGSSSAIDQNQRAFRRWLRRKYEQSREERRQKRREERLLRRRQRRSIKRFQLQQDLQLAKSFGYS